MQTEVVLETTSGQRICGEAVRAQGHETGVKIAGGNWRGTIERIRVVGHEEQTNPERARDEFILRALQGHFPSIADSAFVQMLWFPLPTSKKCARERGLGGIEMQWRTDAFRGLNASQKQVVRAIWADDEPLVVAHGADVKRIHASVRC